MATPSARGF